MYFILLTQYQTHFSVALEPEEQSRTDASDVAASIFQTHFTLSTFHC